MRPVERNGLHLTLCFIGMADSQQVQESLRLVQAGSFSITINGLGRFCTPGGGILWAGVEYNDDLYRLRVRLLNRLLEAGIQAADTKEFNPHVTLARYKTGVSRFRISRFLQQSDQLVLEPTPFHQFVLFSSEPRSRGPVYRIEQTYTLD